MAQICKRRWNLLLHTDEKEREKKSIEEASAISSLLLYADSRRIQRKITGSLVIILHAEGSASGRTAS